MKFFFDRNIAQQFARMIDAFDSVNTIRPHDDMFDPKTTDIEWMQKLGEEDEQWFVLSGDIRILRREKELLALRSSELTFFSLARGWMNMELEIQAWKLVKIWPDIVAEAMRARTPSVFEIPPSGNKIVARGSSISFRKK